MFSERWGRRQRGVRRKKKFESTVVMQWPFKVAYEKVILDLVQELDVFANFVAGITALKDQLAWANEIFSVSESIWGLVDQVECGEISIASMDDLVQEQAEFLDDILSNPPPGFLGVKISGKDAEMFLDEFERKIEELVKPVHVSGYRFYHVLIGAA